MISQNKLEANRRNAQKSTGPKTAEGKAISSQNGLTHGLTSAKTPILPGENRAEFESLHEALLRDLNPRGILQREIVWDLAQVRWKLRRLPLIEAELMRREQLRREQECQRAIDDAKRFQYTPTEPPPDLDPISILANEFGSDDNAYSRMELYRQRMQRQMHTLLRELRKLREETGEEDENLTRDTGLRPVPEVEERLLQTEQTQHGPEAPVTVERTDVIGKTEPTDSRKRINSDELATEGTGETPPEPSPSQTKGSAGASPSRSEAPIVAGCTLPGEASNLPRFSLPQKA